MRLDAEQKERGSFSRKMRRDARDLGKQQLESKAKIEEMNSAIKEENQGEILGYSFIFEELARDMDRVAESLKKKKVGLFTQSLEADVLQNLIMLQASLEDEIRARRNMDQQQPKPEDQQSQPEQKQPLVSRLAELVLVRNMQTRINDRTKQFVDRSASSTEGLSPVDELLLKRLLNKQAQIAELFQKLVSGAQGGNGEGR